MSDEFFDYERQEPKNPLIAFLLVSSCLVVIALCAFFSWMFILMRDSEHNRKIDQAIYADLQELRKKEDAKLTGYQYVDKDKGVVRIPVERAMQLMAEEAKGAAAKAAVAPAAVPAGVKLEVKPAAAVPPPPPPPPPAKAAAAGAKK